MGKISKRIYVLTLIKITICDHEIWQNKVSKETNTHLVNLQLIERNSDTRAYEFLLQSGRHNCSWHPIKIAASQLLDLVELLQARYIAQVSKAL